MPSRSDDVTPDDVIPDGPPTLSRKNTVTNQSIDFRHSLSPQEKLLFDKLSDGKRDILIEYSVESKSSMQPHKRLLTVVKVSRVLLAVVGVIFAIYGAQTHNGDSSTTGIVLMGVYGVSSNVEQLVCNKITKLNNELCTFTTIYLSRS